MPDAPAERAPAAWTYQWTASSPAQRLFGPPPAGGGKLAAFARATILAQPGDYLSAVAGDLALYFWPYCWTGAAQYSLDQRASPSVAAFNPSLVRAYSGPPSSASTGSIARFLERWRGIVRIYPWMLLLGALFGLTGILLAADRASRDGLALLWAIALALLIVSVAVQYFDFREGVPAAMLLVIVGARGAELIGQRFGAAALTRPVADHPGQGPRPWWAMKRWP